MNKLALIAITLCGVALTGCGPKSIELETGEMEPTIPAGSELIVDLNYYSKADPGRFDIVVFRPPKSYQELWENDLVLCFRIVGLPSEEIQLRATGIYIDSEHLEIPFDIPYGPAEFPEWNSVKLGDNEYFLLGDNSDKALDSRYWGPVPRENILGKVIEVR